MNREDIIRMAVQAEFLTNPSMSYVISPSGCADEDLFNELEAFAKLVAQHEREECAAMVDKYIKETDNMEARGCLASAAYDIRARGNT